MTGNFVGDPEVQLRQVGSESSKVSVDHTLGLRAALEAGIEVFRAVARDPGLGGESGKAASRVFGKHAEEAAQLSETIDSMRKIVEQVEEARGRARELYEALPPKEAPWEQQAAVATAAGGGKAVVTFFSSFGNTTEAASQGVVAGADAVNALNNAYAEARRAKAQEYLNTIGQDMNAAADKFAKANQNIGGTPTRTNIDQRRGDVPDPSPSGDSAAGAAGGSMGGGFPSGGGSFEQGYNGSGPGGSVSSGGGGLVPLPPGVDPSRVPQGHYGTYDPGVVGPDGVPVVRYHPLPDQRGVLPGGTDGRIDPDGPVSSGTTDFGPGPGSVGPGSVGSPAGGYGAGGSGLMAGAGSAALLGGAGLLSRGGLTGGGLAGGAGAGAGFRGVSLASGVGGGAGGAGAGAGARTGAVGGSGALGEGSGARGAASATGSAGAGAGKGGMSMMGAQPMGAQSGEKKNQPGSLGLIAPQLHDDEDKPVMPPSAGAGSRERH